jgi:hypothetical protein
MTGSTSRPECDIDSQRISGRLATSPHAAFPLPNWHHFPDGFYQHGRLRDRHSRAAGVRDLRKVSPRDLPSSDGSSEFFRWSNCFFAPLFGKLSDRIGRKPVLLLSVIGSAVGFFVIGLADAAWMLFLGRIIDGASGGNIATAQACIADVTPP